MAAYLDDAPVQVIRATDGASGLDLRWNGLYSASAPLITFLNSKQLGGDWQSTQTIAPTGLSTSAPMMNSITVNWTPITYTADTGFYEVLHSTTMGGPYTLFGTMTANKSATSLTVTGLLPNTTYYCVARATTNPHGFNVNTVVSELSAEVPCMTALPVELMRFTVE